MKELLQQIALQAGLLGQSVVALLYITPFDLLICKIKYF